MDLKCEYIDERFYKYIVPSAQLEQLYTGARWSEGPVYFADGDYLLWSDIPNNRMLRWTETGGVGVYRQPSNYVNGNTRDRQGRLVSCEHGGRRVSRTEPDGRITILADNFQGKRLNSPNDVVVKSDGSIWFTDPSYGILSDYEGYKGESELGACHVFRLDAHSGKLTIVADSFVKPNGLAFSADESILYISDTGASHDPDGPHHIRAFDVGADATLSNGRVFATINPGVPDGFRVDTDGNIWTSAADGVHCYSPAGELLGKILVPETVANVTFGGPRRNRLFIAASTSLYSVSLGSNGIQTP